MGKETEPPKLSAKEKRQAAAKLKAGAVAKKEKGGQEGDATAEVRQCPGPARLCRAGMCGILWWLRHRVEGGTAYGHSENCFRIALLVGHATVFAQALSRRPSLLSLFPCLFVCACACVCSACGGRGGKAQ
jgi:hypothetical protein